VVSGIACGDEKISNSGMDFLKKQLFAFCDDKNPQMVHPQVLECPETL